MLYAIVYRLRVHRFLMVFGNHHCLLSVALNIKLHNRPQVFIDKQKHWLNKRLKSELIKKGLTNVNVE